MQVYSGGYNSEDAFSCFLRLYREIKEPRWGLLTRDLGKEGLKTKSFCISTIHFHRLITFNRWTNCPFRFANTRILCSVILTLTLLVYEWGYRWHPTTPSVCRWSRGGAEEEGGSEAQRAAAAAGSCHCWSLPSPEADNGYRTPHRIKTPG